MLPFLLLSSCVASIFCCRTECLPLADWTLNALSYGNGENGVREIT